MDKIVKVWFDDNRIFIETDNQQTLSRPLEAFPTLKDASEKDRNDLKIGRFGDDIRWETLDEDLHISSCYEKSEPNPDNEVGRIFRQFPQLDVAAVASDIGIHKSLLYKFIYGIQEPSQERMRQIKSALHNVGKRLIVV